MSKIVAKLNEVYVFWLKWSKFLTPTYIHNKPKYTSRKGKSEFDNSSGVIYS